jgi:acyl-CoA thioester hydrolase
VRPEWLDINQHMNVAYYALVFDQAAEAFMAYLGVDDAYIHGSGFSWVALESHTTFRRELGLGEPLRVCAQLLGADAKRIHLFQTLYQAETGLKAATNELMILHLDLTARRGAAFPEEVGSRLTALATAQRDLPVPPERGSVIGLR